MGAGGKESWPTARCGELAYMSTLNLARQWSLLQGGPGGPPFTKPTASLSLPLPTHGEPASPGDGEITLTMFSMNWAWALTAQVGMRRRYYQTTVPLPLLGGPRCGTGLTIPVSPQL